MMAGMEMVWGRASSVTEAWPRWSVVRMVLRGGVAEGGEGGVEAGRILNHKVMYSYARVRVKGESDFSYCGEINYLKRFISKRAI